MNERALFEFIASASTPGWQIKLQDGLDVGSANGLAAQDVFVYGVDTKTGWIGAVSMTQANFEQARKDAQSIVPRNLVFDCAGEFIKDEGLANSNADDPSMLNCMKAVVYALTTTQTFNQVRQLNPDGLAGHWVYLIYQTRRGSTVGRPGFFTGGKGFMLTPLLEKNISRIIEIDFNPSKRLQAAIAVDSAGGAVIHSNFTHA
jgi:hypothetical protein